MWDKLETVSGVRDDPPDEGDIQASIAISLKRVADLMQHNQLPTYDGRLLVDTRF